jgi:hypothetical protein
MHATISSDGPDPDRQLMNVIARPRPSNTADCSGPLSTEDDGAPRIASLVRQLMLSVLPPTARRPPSHAPDLRPHGADLAQRLRRPRHSSPHPALKSP